MNAVDWNPAIHSMLVSVSDDCTIKVWGPASASSLGSEGATEDMQDTGSNEGFVNDEEDEDDMAVDLDGVLSIQNGVSRSTSRGASSATTSLPQQEHRSSRESSAMTSQTTYSSFGWL